MFLLFFEFLGTTELMVILVAALVLFGPRKLPEISRQIGKGLAEFRKASDDFRQTWEKEVHREFTLNESEPVKESVVENQPITENTIGRGHLLAAADKGEPAFSEFTGEPLAVTKVAEDKPDSKADPEPQSKRDWI
jgi:TatA/E family protein of Tat protein translocase